MYKRILVPIDGSATAALGLQEAIKLAKCYGSQLRLINIVDELPVVSPPVAAATADLVIAQLRSAGDSILEDGERAAREAGVQVDSKLLEEMGSQVGVYILREAEAWPADLIVCGTHGRRGIRRVVMGSDAEYVVRRSSVPVLLVPDQVTAARKVA
jgi:nucleotide-binding universal stress UspA family protein